jgi:Tfp pilus assembly PilM family ATPase
MKNGVAYILLSDGKVQGLYRKDRNSEPMLLNASAETEKAAVGQVVSFAADNGVDLDRAVVALDGRRCLLRHYALPVQSMRELNQVVAFEQTEDLPFDQDDFVSDFFRGCCHGGISHVSSAVVQKSYLAEVLEAFEEQGIKVEQVDVDVAAFARVCQRDCGEYDKCVGFDVGQERTLFCFLENGKIRQLAVIPWGEGALVRGAMEDLGCSQDAIDRVMLFAEVEGEDAAKRRMRESFGKHLEGFVRRLMRESYRLMGEADWPSHFVLSGEIVRVQNFREVFEEVSEGSLDVWDELSLKLGSEVEVGQRGSGLATIHGAVEKGESFNLLKGEFAPKGGGFPMRRQLAYGVSLLLALLLAWGGYVYATLVAGERELAYLGEATRQVYADALPGVNGELAVAQLESVLTSRLALLTGESPDGMETPAVIETLRAVSNVLDSKIKVEFLTLSLDEKRIDVQGETRSLNEVEGVRTAFAKTKFFKGVKIKNATTDKGSGKVRFEIEVVR